MDRYVSATIVLAFLVFALSLLAVGWRSRIKRQSHLPALATVPDDLGHVIGVSSGLYVATTLSGQRLERVAVSGLGFRSRMRISVHTAGAVLEIPGQADSFIPSSALRAVSRSTWTIDRVVEDGGLVCVEWNLGTASVESFFRVEDSQQLIDFFSTIISAAHSTDIPTRNKA
ncbi:MAG: hypothetical protein ACOH1J_02960 [Microbacteriaceae bacterium]